MSTEVQEALVSPVEPNQDLILAVRGKYAHVLNWCEVFYDFHRASGPKDALGAVEDLARVGVAKNAEIGTEFWQAVGALKAIHRRVSRF